MSIFVCYQDHIYIKTVLVSSDKNREFINLCSIRNGNEFSYLHSSCNMLILLSLVTRFTPADRISCCPLRHSTVSFEYGLMTTHVSNASLPSLTTAGPPVPVNKQEITFN